MRSKRSASECGLMTFNQKPSSKSQASRGPFKRAVAGCIRAVAKMPEIEVTFTAEKPGLDWNNANPKAQLPEPSRKLDIREAAILRGHADSLALWLDCHNRDVH